MIRAMFLGLLLLASPLPAAVPTRATSPELATLISTNIPAPASSSRLAPRAIAAQSLPPKRTTMIAATCANLAALLLQAQGGETYILRGSCAAIAITARPHSTVTVDASGATVRGLTITGGNIRWLGGTISAAAGAFAVGPPGYGVLLRGATEVRFDGITVTAAKKGLVLDGSAGVTFADSRFTRYGEDGIIASNSDRVAIIRNRFGEVIGRPTSCVIGTTTIQGLSGRDCLDRRGIWTDGYHCDAVQMRNAMTNVLIEGNVVEGATQGLTQMDTAGDAPLQRVLIRSNIVRTDGYHRITLGNCINCLITGNTVARAEGSTKKAIIIPGQAVECGNTVEDGRSVACR